ncbi:MAG: Rieske (2Fe-2S) protein [Parasphingorhabdus sp.]|uniref:Rieske (2Fe-2S) protein n=2 Tax=Parasphingorhabdus sp. TaxID=2709688 RepID=UPI0032659784
MIEVGQLERDVGASAKRAIEDELDWEHLPHTHRTTFSAVSLIHSDRNGWEADVILVDGTPMRMKVTLDEDRLGYTNATFSEGTENGRAVCRISETGSDSCRMSLRFFVPDISGLDREGVGAFYVDLFGRLIDEDEPKMIYTTEALKAGGAAHKQRRKAALADGTMVRVPVVCPHQGLPLNCEPDASGIMTCPWHGYQFDARSGECVSGQVKGWRS